MTQSQIDDRKSKRAVLRRKDTRTAASLLKRYLGKPRHLDHFERAAKSQSKSLLLLLPGELRMKVLRNLLKSEKVIETKSELRESWLLIYPDGEKTLDITEREYLQQTTLSSQLMRCCQMLYDETRYVLYQENKLSIKLSQSSCHVLDLDLNLPQFTRKLDDQDQDILSIAKDRRSLRPFLTIYPIIAGFGAIVVKMSPKSHADLYADCRLFRNLLHGKRITISFSSAQLSTVRP